MRNILVPFYCLLLVSCSTKDENTISNTKLREHQHSDKETDDSLNYYFDLVLDSLDKMGTHSALVNACRTHFDRRTIPFDPKILSTQFIVDNFRIIPYNSVNILSVNCDHWSRNEPKYLLYFIDQHNVLMNRDTIFGCHYHNGQLNAFDWNKDGDDELLFTIHYPTSSIYFDDYILQVFEYDTINGLESIFRLIERTRDCGIPADETYGTETIRNYTWINKQSLRITESIYKFDCASSEREKPVKYEKKISSKSYTMNWNKTKRRFTE